VTLQIKASPYLSCDTDCDTDAHAHAYAQPVFFNTTIILLYSPAAACHLCLPKPDARTLTLTLTLSLT